MADDYVPIDCDLHDYIEIACIKGYLLRLELSDGSVLQAVANSTETLADKTEWLILLDGEVKHTLRLDKICAFTPLAENADFGRIVLRD